MSDFSSGPEPYRCSVCGESWTNLFQASAHNPKHQEIYDQIADTIRACEQRQDRPHAQAEASSDGPQSSTESAGAKAETTTARAIREALRPGHINSSTPLGRDTGAMRVPWTRQERSRTEPPTGSGAREERNPGTHRVRVGLAEVALVAAIIASAVFVATVFVWGWTR